MGKGLAQIAGRMQHVGGQHDVEPLARKALLVRVALDVQGRKLRNGAVRPRTRAW